jgi:hypothetical protein
MISTMAANESGGYWRPRDGVREPAVWVAFVLSLLIHGAALWQWLPHVRLSFREQTEGRDSSSMLSVQLAPRSIPAPPSVPAPMQAQRQAKAVAPKAAPRPQAAPPVIALNERAANVPAPQATPTPVAPPSPARPAVEGDLSSYIEARRRARAESAPSPATSDSVPNATTAEDENTRANRIAAANLGVGTKPTFGREPHGGGIFSIHRLREDYAEFIFFGWSKDIQRNTAQLIEVRRGSDSDIRIAVVRKMISIIREHEQGDFQWESKRLGRQLTLSARVRDNAGLEDFMLREFPEFGYGSRFP